ncbi:putative glutathione S-transferase-like [Capsicum annuum]|uniref:Glutathione S-transferase C-terminal domain-containing protein n=1 Tax=Capsicum annuum TaxID=4072 RepID=A0A2G2YRD8_CAPAN|nr:putative glutathione S-transferase-like [Capsicum annuum]KAF3626067.1 putative glutathione S-transferase-like [Capsicum annuum]PHT72312.1 hypothetical protein T459_23097 [Capsicum annuum]
MQVLRFEPASTGLATTLVHSGRNGEYFLMQRRGQEKSKEEACEMLKVLDNELKDKKFLVGDKFGFVDMTAMALWLGVFQEVVLSQVQNL